MPYQGPGIYRHYKGPRYVVLGLGQHTETKETLVIYQRLDQDGRQIFARPPAVFNEEVKRSGGLTVPRFVFITRHLRR